MILQALNRYYERANLAPPGWEYKEIPFLIIIDRQGHFLRLENKTSIERRRGSPVLVPKSEIRSGKNAWQKPNLLWDHYGFVLGQPRRKPNGDLDPTDSPEKANSQLGAFISRIENLANLYPDSVGLLALRRFYLDGEYQKVVDDPASTELFKIPGANITFALHGEIEPILHDGCIVEYVESSEPKTDDESLDSDDAAASISGFCLVSGQIAPIARLHPKTKGVCDKPAALSAANTGAIPAVSSYRKEQGYNFPISEATAFRYSTALNHLLAKDSRQHLQVGNTSTVFWAEEPHDLETAMADLFGEPPKDNPNKNTDSIKALYSSIQSGKFSVGSLDTRFHVLGLAPNAARISVRFWETAAAVELAKRIKQHFDDLSIVHADYEPEYLSLFRLLTGIAVLNKADNIPPNLVGDVMRAILEGLPYPSTLLTQAVIRCRAEQNVSYARAATIKASLNRWIRFRNTQEKEFTSMLDPSNTNPAYRLGRLFATLERIQEDAAGGPGKVNATIRDRYYGAASSTPAAVFSTLLRLEKHHIGKLSPGLAVVRERLLGEIMDGFDSTMFPPRHLSLPDQARFALGYYQQRQAFFTKTESNNTPEETQ